MAGSLERSESSTWFILLLIIQKQYYNRKEIYIIQDMK